MQLDYAGQHFEATANDCLFFDSNKPHSYYTKTTASFQYVRFGGNQSEYCFNKLCANDMALFKARNPKALSSCFARIAEETEQSIPDEHLISAYLHELLSFALSSREKFATENAKRIAQSIQFMKDHINEQIHLKDVAEQIHLSPYYLHRIFKSYTNSSPGEYFMNLRLAHAKMLLVTSSHPVHKISGMCGFNTSAHFINIFQKRTGTTPLRYRKLNSVVQK